MSTATGAARLEGKSKNANRLLRYLASHGGSVPDDRVFAAAEVWGMSRRTLLRAAREVGVRKERNRHRGAVWTAPRPYDCLRAVGPYYAQWAPADLWVAGTPWVGCYRCEAENDSCEPSGWWFGRDWERNRSRDDSAIYFLPDGRVIPCRCGNGAPLRIGCALCRDGRITVHGANAIEACWDCTTETAKDYAYVLASDPWAIGMEYGPEQIPRGIPWQSWPKRWALETCHACDKQGLFMDTPQNHRERVQHPERRYCFDCWDRSPRRRPDESLAAAIGAFIDERDLIGDLEQLRLDWVHHRRGPFRAGLAEEWQRAGNLPEFTAALRLAVVTRFVDECLTFGEGLGTITKAELFQRWSAWADAEGFPPGSPVAFGRALSVASTGRLKPKRMSKARTWGWQDIKINEVIRGGRSGQASTARAGARCDA